MKGDASQSTIPDSPFGAPDVIGILSTAGPEVQDPTLTGDLLEIYFVGRNSQLGDIFRATRNNATDPWGAPLLVLELNSGQDETTPKVSEDGLIIRFASLRGGGPGQHDLWVSTRSSRTDSWGPPLLEGDLNSTEGDFHATSTSLELDLILSSNRSGGAGARDFYSTTRKNQTDPWGIPVALTELNTTSGEGSAHLGPAGSWFFFSSNRPGGSGSNDMYWTVRPSLGTSFETPQSLNELNTSFGDSDPWVSGDLRYLVFTSDRSGRWEIYEASR